MKRFTGLLNRTKSSSSSDFLAPDNAPVDSPEANAARSIRLFCESASTGNRDEEVLHLPVIVEAAESSPSAANAAALQIRRFLAKDFGSKPYVQYNAIMLVRILVDNPGPIFTRCFDEPFVKTVKDLLKGCKDKSTQQILRETLDYFEVNKGYDEGLQGLLDMWRRQKGAQASLSHSASVSRGGQNGSRKGSKRLLGGAPLAMPQQSDHRVFHRHQLPPAHELASRIEESRNTAKILLQLVQSTPPEDLLSNELVREFSERCQSAQKSMQTYINCDSPAPDDDTMLTLIETNEQLSLASSRYQRAVLSARKAMGTSTSPNPEAINDGYGAFSQPVAPGQTESLFAAQPPQRQPTNGFSSPSGHTSQQQLNQTDDDEDLYHAPPGPPPGRSYPSPPLTSQAPGIPQTAYEPHSSNPFLDPEEHSPNPAPLATEPTTYGPVSPPRKPVNTPSNITYSSAFPPAPASNTASPASPVSPTSPQSLSARPVGPYHSTGITPSYIGRQASASNGLTMHGAQVEESIPEIDGHSTVGRDGTVSAGANRGGNVGSGSGSGFQVSPVESRHSQRPAMEPASEQFEKVARRISRVDVAGTGGLRGA